MAVLQSTYGNRISDRPYLLGMIVNQELHNSITALLEDATAGYGEAMFQGTADNQATATPGTAFLGVTIRDVIIEGEPADTFNTGDSLSLCEKGVIVVQASEAVAKGAQAYVTAAGAWTDTLTGNTEVPGATFDASTTAAGLVPLRIK